MSDPERGWLADNKKETQKTHTHNRNLRVRWQRKTIALILSDKDHRVVLNHVAPFVSVFNENCVSKNVERNVSADTQEMRVMNRDGALIGVYNRTIINVCLVADISAVMKVDRITSKLAHLTHILELHSSKTNHGWCSNNHGVPAEHLVRCSRPFTYVPSKQQHNK